MLTTGPLPAPIAYLPSLLYEAVIRSRNWMYSSGILSRNHLPKPVISIGNLTMGGTGKTPLIAYTARILSEMGFKIAILTRGYGRENPDDLRIVPPDQTLSTPDRVLGDEPAWLRRQLPLAWLGVSKNRFQAGSIIATREDRIVFLLDDGFQHRKLYRDLDIVLIDSSQPLERNRVFPMGTLREPIKELRRADAIFVNVRPGSPSIAEFEDRMRNFILKAPIFFCTQSIHELAPFAFWKDALKPPVSPELPRSAYLVAAIGNPKRFYTDIASLGIEVRGATFYRDHHRISERDWVKCSQDAQRTGAEIILITEKDAIKITQPPEFPLMVAVQSTEIPNADGFRQFLQSRIQKQTR